MRKPLDLKNKRFGKLVAKKIVGETEKKAKIWHCKCDCGKTRDVIAGFLNTEGKHKVRACKDCSNERRIEASREACKKMQAVTTKHERNSKLVEDSKTLSTWQLVKKYKLTKQRIYQIIKRWKKSSNQSEDSSTHTAVSTT